MKGLIYKDLQIMKSNAGVMGAAIGIACLMLLATDTNALFVINYVVFMAAVMGMNTLTIDTTGGSMAAVLSLPVERSAYVREKYLFTILLGAGVGLVSMPLGMLVGLKKGGVDWMDFFAALPIGLLFLCVMTALMLPLQLQFGGDKARVVIFAVIMAFVLVLYGVNYILKSFGVSAEELAAGILNAHFAVVLAAGAGLALVFLLLSMGISIMIINRKEY